MKKIFFTLFAILSKTIFSNTYRDIVLDSSPSHKSATTPSNLLVEATTTKDTTKTSNQTIIYYTKNTIVAGFHHVLNASKHPKKKNSSTIIYSNFNHIYIAKNTYVSVDALKLTASYQNNENVAACNPQKTALKAYFKKNTTTAKPQKAKTTFKSNAPYNQTGTGFFYYAVNKLLNLQNHHPIKVLATTKTLNIYNLSLFHLVPSAEKLVHNSQKCKNLFSAYTFSLPPPLVFI